MEWLVIRTKGSEGRGVLSWQRHPSRGMVRHKDKEVPKRWQMGDSPARQGQPRDTLVIDQGRTTTVGKCGANLNRKSVLFDVVWHSCSWIYSLLPKKARTSLETDWAVPLLVGCAGQFGLHSVLGRWCSSSLSQELSHKQVVQQSNQSGVCQMRSASLASSVSRASVAGMSAWVSWRTFSHER